MLSFTLILGLTPGADEREPGHRHPHALRRRAREPGRRRRGLRRRRDEALHTAATLLRAHSHVLQLAGQCQGGLTKIKSLFMAANLKYPL